MFSFYQCMLFLATLQASLEASASSQKPHGHEKLALKKAATSVHRSASKAERLFRAKKAAKHFTTALSSKDAGLLAKPKHSGSTCVDLKNHGTHFTVELKVGTPPQKFDVVADTGSDAIIVPSCACVKMGSCSKGSRCFQGTNKSSTFFIEMGKNGPPVVRMMFGSGPVQAVVATDQVRVGSLHTKMEDGILLMTDHLLNIKGPFEGILGLGLPSSGEKKGLYRESPPDPAMTEGGKGSQGKVKTVYAAGTSDKAIGSAGGVGNLGGVSIFPGVPSGGHHDGMYSVPGDLTQVIVGASGASLLAKPKPVISKSLAHKVESSDKLSHETSKKSSQESQMVVKGFAEEVGIKRFSMCFNDGASGALRLGTPKQKLAHASVGKVHWGLDFRGISVGDKEAPVQFCQPGNMTKGQKSPCGAIPDSGTTTFMAPKEHLVSLFDSLCDKWDRCKKNYTAMVKAAKAAHKAAVKEFKVDPFDIHAASKATIFQQLVFDCRHWMTKSEGLEELPPIHFHVRGDGGTKQTLKLEAWSYVLETNEKEFKYIYKNIPGFGNIPVGKKFTGKTQKVCSPAFSAMDYDTALNGPVWILGTPIFYEYQVHYDLNAKRPAISFSSTPCGSCREKADHSLVSQHISTEESHRDTQQASRHSSSGQGRSERGRQPRQVLGPFRMPNIDVSQPL